MSDKVDKLVVTITCPYCREGTASTEIYLKNVDNSSFISFGPCSRGCKATTWGFQVRYGYLVGEGKQSLNPIFVEE